MTDKHGKKFAVMADLHLHNWGSFATENGYHVNTRLQILLDGIWQCARHLSEVEKGNTGVIVLAGDIFHVRGSVAPTVLNPTMETLREIWQECGTSFYILSGNHDLEGRNSNHVQSAVSALGENDYVTVVNNPNGVEFEKIDSILIPWHEDIQSLKGVLESRSEETRKGKNVIIHAPIDGVIQGLPAHGLTPEYLASLGYKGVFSGHYHNHKVFPGNVVSIGALAHHTWGDVGTKAGYLIVDTHVDHETAFTHHETSAPRFVHLTHELMNDDLPALVKGNYVSLTVESASSKGIEATQAREQLLQAGAEGVIIKVEPKLSADIVRGDHSVKSGETLEQSVSSFIEKNERDLPVNLVVAEALSVLSSIVQED